MLRYFINRVIKKSIFRPRVVAAVPAFATDVEKRTLISVIITAGARSVCLIESPLCAAFGSGVDPMHPNGVFVIDIGGGTTDIAVISLGGIVVSNSIKIAGDAFDETIIRYIRKKRNVVIGVRTAEELKINIGCVSEKPEKEVMSVRGRCLVTGLPKAVEVSSDEMLEALCEPAGAIADAVHSVLERTPPELVGDISREGIVLTGGGSLIFGLDTLLSKETGIDVRVAEDAASCVALGTGKVLESLDILADSLTYSGKKYTS